MATETIAEEVTASAAPLLAKGVGEAKKMFSKSLYRFTKSSQFMWHAYLGTAATAEETAVSFAKSMAEKGSSVESKAMKTIDSRISKLKAKSMEAKARLSKLSSAKVEKVEKTIGMGLNKTLLTVGVPTKGDMDELALLMSDMSKSIESLVPLAEAKAKRTSSAKTTTA